MGGLIETAAGVLDPRRLTTTYVPVLGFLAAIGGVLAAGVGWQAAAAWWSGLPGGVTVVIPLLVLVVTLLLGQVLAVLRGPLFRLYEGYWDGLPFGARLARRCRHRYRELRSRLPEDDPAVRSYPAADGLVMPTALGNLLRAAEEHPYDRYGIDATTTWPRLYPILPEGFRGVLAVASADLDLMVTVSALGVAFAVVGGSLAAALLSWPAVILCFAAGCVVAWLAYRGAVRSAGPYGQLFCGAFDVHRWALLDSMGLRRPDSYQAEPEQWRQLDKLWTVGAVDSTGAAALGYPSSLSSPVTADAPASRHGEDRKDDQPVRSLRLGYWLLAVAVVAATALAAVAATRPGPVTATRPLAPYRQLTAADVAGGRTDRVIGRYPLQPIADGARVDPDRLGPRLDPARLVGKVATTVRRPPGKLHADTAAAGVLGALRPVTGAPINDILVLGVRVDSGLVVVLTPTQLQAVLTWPADTEVYFVVQIS